MHIRPIPIGLILFGIAMIGGSLNDAAGYVRRDPLWAFRNWRYVLKSSLWWLIVGLVALGAGIAGLFL